ncbi:PaaI family thioesterase [Bradyrhizobium barranii]|uniref:PaaI family thioesterase n=1 Tax=Bradyrhizobium barranii TaxID=2992140 RepID=UPI0024AF2F14|nr:PaaI family thioesterase [Bradyrhizobium barranii]WFT92413.1 PaaI family thioesterase [Bradyrhizobium barranii]
MTDAAANLPPGAQLLGREWLGFDESGHALIRFQAQLAFTNRHGTIQGGFLAAMLDSATGIGALAALSPDLTVVTRSLDTRFLKPAAVGAITARARCRTDGSRYGRAGRARRCERHHCR